MDNLGDSRKVRRKLHSVLLRIEALYRAYDGLSDVMEAKLSSKKGEILAQSDLDGNAVIQFVLLIERFGA